MQVIDNFLPKDEFERLQEIVMYKIPYFFIPKINSGHDKEDNSCYLIHTLYNYEYFPALASNWLSEFKSISDKLEIVSLMRMKLNFYPRTDKVETHIPHTDYKISHKGCILSFNTCDGGTVLYEDEKEILVESVANRALLFDPSKWHSSTSCTNAKARFNVNINYF